MKKISTIFLIALMHILVNAQTGNDLEYKFRTGHAINAEGLTNIKIPEFKAKYDKGKGTATKWFCLAKEYQDSLFPGGTDNISREYIFPDTLMKFKYGGSYSSAYVAGVGSVIDPFANIFWEERVNKTKSYTVDSIMFPLFYKRNLNSTDADTLEIEVITNYRGPIRYYLGSGSNGYYKNTYGVDTLNFGTVFFDPETLKADQSKFDEEYDKLKYKHAEIHTYKYQLTENDTFYDPVFKTQIVKIATPGLINDAGSGIAVTFKYRPGFTYKEGDRMEKKNYITYYSYRENGVDTYATYTPGDLNTSLTLFAPLYFDPTQKWYGYYYSQWGMSCDPHFQNHWLYAQLTYDTNLDIAENEERTVMLSQNIPNPAENSTMIKYTLKNSSNVMLALTDMTGRKVKEINVGKQNPGEHMINLNTSGLTSGIYYYSLIADETKLTLKMIVNR